ncbi:MAG: hypothetical protein ACM3YM_04450 [Sphingomonadales bacterium]
MGEPTKDESGDGLNPDLKSRIDTTYDTTRRTPAPFDSASAKEGEGERWPVIWLVIVILCVAVTIYYLI